MPVKEESSSAEEFFVVLVPKVSSRIYEVQHDGGNPGRWSLVQKPDFEVIFQEARLYEIHSKDIEEAHRLLDQSAPSHRIPRRWREV
jgi:hypothetical protein